MAFIIPLVLAGSLLAKEEKWLYGLPKWLDKAFSSKHRYKYMVLFVVWAGANEGAQIGWAATLAANLIAFTIIMLFILFWRKGGRHERYTLKQLLPNRKETKVLVFPLIAIYTIFGLLLNFEKIPGIIGQGTIWIFYLGAIILLGYSLKYPSKMEDEKGWSFKFEPRLISILFFIFLTSALLAGLSGVAIIALVITFLGAIIIEVYFLIYSIKDVFRGFQSKRTLTDK
jgi:hypothetical protein